MKIKKHNLEKAFDTIDEYWSPSVVSELNGQAVKIAKFKGDFVMHNHEHEDEFFYVVKGQLSIELEDQTLILDPGECVNIPRGVNHRPFAETETWVMMFEPQCTVNTGQIENELTKRDLKKL
jgi:mannose-6-phosphate isomerase-like protein (cupin superfamily)